MVSVTPATADVRAGKTLQLSAALTNATDTTVSWSVDAVAGGNAALGTISAGGLYSAPARVPSPALVTVTALSHADPGQSGSAQITIHPAIAVRVSPPAASVDVSGTTQLAVAVSNAADPSVSWSVNGVAGGNATVGTVTSSGLYTAPGSLPSPATVSVTATSLEDLTASGSAQVTIVAQVTVSINPPSIAMPVSARQQFTATVANTSNTAVVWKVNGVANGNSTVGIVTQAGAYTAPAAVPSPATVRVSAVSQADATRSGSAAVTVTTGIVSISPSSAVVAAGSGTQQFTGNVLNANTAVTWKVNGIPGGNATVGTISAAGLYTSTWRLPEPSAVTVTAVAQVDPKQSASAAVTQTWEGQQCAAEPISSSGTKQYVCDCGNGADPGCVAGDDSNAGTSPAAPWRTHGKAVAAFASMAAGDTLAFCKGGAFDLTTSGTWVNASCTAANPCIVRDYPPPWGNGQEARPRLFTNGTGAGLNLANGGSAAHEEGYRFLNLDLEGGGTGEEALFVYNDVTDVTLCNVVFSHWAFGASIQGANAPGPGSDGKNARIVVRGSRFLANHDSGYLGSCSGCVVEYSYFDGNGSDGASTNHGIYYSGAETSAGVYTTTGERITGNELHHSVLNNNHCSGPIVVSHGQHQEMLIDHNLIVEGEAGTAGNGCWGIETDTGYYGTPEFFNALILRGNRIYNVGNQALSIGICQSCVVEDNLVVWDNPGMSGTAIKAPGQSPCSGCASLTAMTVWNNSLYFGPSSTASATGISIGDAGTGHVITNNALYASGTSATDAFACFNLNLAASAYDSDHNLCWFPGLSQGKWEATHGSLASWQSFSSLDAHSRVADPKFVSPLATAYDFIPGTGSALIGACDSSKFSIVDLLGNIRPVPCDIGAYQH